LSKHKRFLTDGGGKRADLSSADLCRANLSGADLSSANLSSADLRSADLRSADLRSANLSSADLRSANLSSANLSSANLSSAYLCRADLRSADLSGADLRSANLSGANLGPRSIVPSSGSFVGWKKLYGGEICQLEIPAEAARTSSYIGRKCRAEFVRVISGEGRSVYDETFLYAPGIIVRADVYDPDPRVECSGGIHFFITREEAQEY
jgi:hypothetical protein